MLIKWRCYDEQNMHNEETTVITETIRFWKEHSGEILSPEDAREVIQNITGFFKVLQDWDKKTSQFSN